MEIEAGSDVDEVLEPSAIELACEAVGGASRLAEKLTVSPQAISKWVKAKRAPAERCLEIEKITGVSRYKLRPDVFGEPPAIEEVSTRAAA